MGCVSTVSMDFLKPLFPEIRFHLCTILQLVFLGTTRKDKQPYLYFLLAF